MKKITSLLNLLLLTMVSLNVSAQNIEDYGTPLITDASQFYDNQYGDEGEGTDQSQDLSDDRPDAASFPV